MRIGFLQFDPQERSPENNIKFILSRTSNISSALIVLPEFFLSSIVAFTAIDEAAFPHLLTPLLKHSSDRDLAFVGSVPCRSGNTIYNRALYVNNGAVVGQYDKRKLFESENDVMTPGNARYQVFEYDQLKFSIQICFDNLDPTIVHDAAKREGIDLLIAPGGVSVSFIRDILKARALENQVMAIFCNRMGYDHRTYYCGGSAIIYPDGNQVGADSPVALQLVSVSQPELADTKSKRKRFFASAHRGSDHYDSFSAKP